MRIRPSVTSIFSQSSDALGEAGHDYCPSPTEGSSIRINREGFQNPPQNKEERLQAEIQRLEEYDKSIQPSIFQPSIPGAGSALSMVEKLIAKAVTSALASLVKLLKKQQVEAAAALREANERDARRNSESLDRSNREHFQRLERDADFRNDEGRAIDRGESRSRAGDDTMVA